MIKLDDRISEKCGKAIIITGCARSGTTIIGKILHTFKDVEYSFEPPTILSLFTLLPQLLEHQWKFLYETYLYEEFLMNALAGRGLNCNRRDDSSVYNTKSKELIEKRLSRSLGKAECEKMSLKSRILFKMPSITPFLPRILEYYPDTTLIIMHREAPNVFASFLEKGWFRDKTLSEENVIWPNRFLNGMRIPFWVADSDDEEWIKMDELHRIAYYYVRMSTPVEDIKNCIKVKYEDLVEKPSEVVFSIADKLGLEKGEMTDNVIRSVSRRRKGAARSILDGLEPHLKQLVERYSNFD